MSRESSDANQSSSDSQWHPDGTSARETTVPDAAFRRVHEAIAGDDGPAERRQALLSVVREALGADVAFLTRVDDEREQWTVVESVGSDGVVETGEEADLQHTLCRHAVEDGIFGVADTRSITDDPAYWRFALGSYLGARVTVDGRAAGALGVARVGPREPYGDDERALVRAAASVAGTDRAVAGVEATATDPRPLGVPAAWFDGGMLTVDADGRVTQVDDAATTMLGRSRSAMLDAPVTTAIDGDDAERVRLAVREARDTDTPVALEVCRGDALLWLGVYPSDGAVNVYLREATERREHERVLERVTDGFLSLDERLRFTYVNGQAGEFLGLAPGFLEGASVETIDADDNDDGDAIEGVLADAIRRARDEGETVGFEARTPDQRWVYGRAYPDDDGVSVYLHDVTERRRREQLLDGLLSHTRDLLAVESRRAVADVLTDAVEDAVGFESARVFLWNDDVDLLVPAESLDNPRSPATGPLHDPDTGPVGRAFSDGTPRVTAMSAPDGAVAYSGPVSTDDPTLVVPLGDHGVVVVRPTDEGTVGEDDVSLVSLIAETAVAALDRARRSERLSTYERVLDASRDLVYAIDDGGQLTFVSPALAERLGYDPARLVGDHLTTVLSTAGGRAVADAVRRLARDGEDDTTVETEAVTADGERVPVEVAVSVVADGGPTRAVGVVREIGDLEAVREELSQERTRFSRLFDALPDPALEVEVADSPDDPTVRTVNPAFERAFDVDARSVTGEPLASALAAESDPTDETVDGDPVERVERAVRDRQAVSFQLRQPTSDGLRDFVFQVIPYRETDERVRAFGIYTDITEQRDRERRLEVLNRVLRHNMRTQLNVVDGYADYLSDQFADAVADGADTVTVDVDAHAVTAARRVRDAAERVLDLADEARRTLKMIDRDRDDGPVDLADVARSVVEEYDAEHPTATVDLAVHDGDERIRVDGGDVTEWPSTEPPEVLADVGHDVGLALAQLVENGIVHNRGDAHVEVTVTRTGDHVSVTVADDGPGIPPHERAVVAGETEPTQLEHGSGLGLWIARWVVEGHGGSVVFPQRDEPADGTTVTLRLPSV